MRSASLAAPLQTHRFAVGLPFRCRTAAPQPGVRRCLQTALTPRRSLVDQHGVPSRHRVRRDGNFGGSGLEPRLGVPGAWLSDRPGLYLQCLRTFLGRKNRAFDASRTLAVWPFQAAILRNQGVLQRSTRFPWWLAHVPLAGPSCEASLCTQRDKVTHHLATGQRHKRCALSIAAAIVQANANLSARFMCS